MLLPDRPAPAATAGAVAKSSRRHAAPVSRSRRFHVDTTACALVELHVRNGATMVAWTHHKASRESRAERNASRVAVKNRRGRIPVSIVVGRLSKRIRSISRARAEVARTCS